MRKKTSNRLKTSIRNILNAAHQRLQNIYDEFADILDSDEDRLSLQFNDGYGKIDRRAQRMNRLAKR